MFEASMLVNYVWVCLKITQQIYALLDKHVMHTKPSD